MTEKSPGGRLSNRPLHFFWLIDCSGSMGGLKIETVNCAGNECVPAMRLVANDNHAAQLLVRTLAFSTGCRWVVSQPTEVNSFNWTDLDADDGVTDLGAALKELAGELSLKKMPERGLPPVIVLLTDGQPTDDWKSGLEALNKQPWGSKSVRIAIAIGQDADFSVLREFTRNPELVLHARNAPELVKMMRWVSTVPTEEVSKPKSQTEKESQDAVVPIPPPPATLQVGNVSPGDVF